jgi:hypothetical protein
MATEKSQEIFNNFEAYIKTPDKRLIGKFSIDELELALCEYSVNTNRPFYIAIQNRVNELKERRKSKKEWIRVILSFISGLIIGLFTAYANGWFRCISENKK